MIVSVGSYGAPVVVVISSGGWCTNGGRSGAPVVVHT
jgi:hypothetical protein